MSDGDAIGTGVAVVVAAAGAAKAALTGEKDQSLEATASNEALYSPVGQDDVEHAEAQVTQGATCDNIVSPQVYREKLKAVGQCGYHPKVERMARERPDSALKMRCCAGPAVQWARLSVATTIVVQIVLFVLVSHSRDCVTAHSTRMNAEVEFDRLPVVGWYITICYILVKLFLEFKSLQYVTIPYLQVVGFFGPNGWPLGFRVWLGLMFLNSSLQCLDHATDTFFSAKLIMSEECNNDLMSSIFDKVKAESFIIRWVPFSFKTMALWMWFALFLQFIIPVMTTVPWFTHWCKTKYEVSATEADHNYMNIYREDQNHGDALMMLGDASGMTTLMQMGFVYVVKREKHSWDERTRNGMTSEGINASLTYVKAGMARGISRVGLVALLENGMQTNLQVSALAIKRAVLGASNNRSFIVFDVGSIILSTVVAMLKLNESRIILDFANRVHQRVESTEHERRDEERQAINWVVWNIRLMRYVFWPLLIFFVAYAICKFVAVFVCEYSVWNISGCVDLSDELKLIGQSASHVSPMVVPTSGDVN